jgi:hypothetical protein
LPLDEAVRSFPHPVEKVWNAVSDTLDTLRWRVERSDPVFHKLKAKTGMSLRAWGSTILIDVSALDDENTKVSVLAETHQMVDWGQTSERVGTFFRELQKNLG